MSPARPNGKRMGPIAILVAIASAALLVAAAGVLAGSVSVLATAEGAGTAQPIRFNHKLHIEQEMECTNCHEGADSQPRATIPVLDKCMECHSEALGESPEEAKVRQYAERGAQIPWIRMNRLPGHVYFSHRAHVTWGDINCAECHGDMRSRTAPVTRSQIDDLDMDRCIACHESRNARTDCLTCHK